MIDTLLLKLNSNSLELYTANAETLLADFTRQGVSFYNNNISVAKFGVDEAYIGNILITKNKELLETLKKTFDIANKVNEQGVANFIAERIDMHQKWNWFLESSVGK